MWGEGRKLKNKDKRRDFTRAMLENVRGEKRCWEGTKKTTEQRRHPEGRQLAEWRIQEWPVAQLQMKQSAEEVMAVVVKRMDPSGIPDRGTRPTRRQRTQQYGVHVGKQEKEDGKLGDQKEV